MFLTYTQIDEAAQATSLPLITKNVYTIPTGKSVGMKIVYRFITKMSKRVGIIFTQEDANKIIVKIGIIDTLDKIIGSLVLDKSEIKLFLDTRNEIFNRFLKEHPNYQKFVI
jgi:hypothetical protein